MKLRQTADGIAQCQCDETIYRIVDERKFDHSSISSRLLIKKGHQTEKFSVA
jgi:hypothetical protein